MKCLHAILAALLLIPAVAGAAPEKDNTPKGPPPSLDNVTWDGRPVTLATLRGKTVIILAYATWSEELNNSEAGNVLGQLRDAIQDKPAVVLAINADKKSGIGPSYLKQHKFVAPNIVTGWDALMPARMGAKNDLFQYAWINPQGELMETGSALAYYEREKAKQYVLTFKLSRPKKLGRYFLFDDDAPAKIRNLLWPLELGQLLTDSEATAMRRGLSESELKAVDKGINHYLNVQSRELAKLAQGEIGDRLAAYERASQLATVFKSNEKSQAAKDLAAELNQDKDFRNELAAKKAYDKALQMAAKTPTMRSKLLTTVSRSFNGTVYGRRAADEVNPASVAARPKSIHTWPELTAAQQEAALTKQREFFDELRSKIPGRGLQKYETERFLFYSDMPGKVITTMYLPYLDQMYTQLCTAFGLDPKKNIWKGKATIVAYTDGDDFHKFQSTFHRDPAMNAQGVANCGGDGTVRIGCTAGHDPSYFAVVLVHETTHGFEWRYRSGDDVPSWLNEGAAEWIASRVVSTDKAIAHKIERAVKQMQQTHSLGGDFFTAQQISAWQYGVAASMTDFLVNYDPAPRTKTAARLAKSKPETSRYRKLIDGIKDGLGWESALHEAYGLTPEQLTQAYGQWMGIPDLRP